MLRSLDVAVVPALAAAAVPPGVVVVIDVLRATSTIVTALDNGASGVIPVRDQDEAIAVMRRVGRERSLLCGERDSQMIAGFDLDNSPLAYTPAAVAGKTLVLTTTNGTRALGEAARGKAVVLCGALLNRHAVATALAAYDDDALLLCAGSEGALSFEDVVCAGAIADELHRHHKSLALSDAARAAETLYGAVAKKLTTAIAGGTHAKALVRLGFADDVALCSRIDASTCVPRYAEGIITAAV